MKPGPKGAPAALHLVNGNPSKKPQHQLASELKPDVVLPDPPDHLDDEAKAYWRRMGPEYVRLGLISQVDAKGFEQICEIVSELRFYQGKKAELGESFFVITTPSGYKQQSPWIQNRNATREALRRWLNEYASTPAARTNFRLLSPQLELFANASQPGNGAEAAANPAARHFTAGGSV